MARSSSNILRLPVDESNATALKRLETRVLVRDATGAAYGVTYKWRDDQTDADLLLESSYRTFQYDGTWHQDPNLDVPGPRDCLACHNSAPDTFSASIRTN
jgi:hypothetical protein